MFKDIIIVDDVFDDPDELVRIARNLEFYSRDSHPETSQEIREGQNIYYSGFRSRNLPLINKKLYYYCNTIIMNKCAEQGTGLVRCDWSVDYSSDTFFHYTTKEDVYNENWFHKDPALYAGVVYLNKNPPPNSGTILLLNGEKITVDNKYNRLVLYRSEITHSIEGTFGNNVYDGRLTLTLFYRKIAIRATFRDNFK